MKYTKTYVYLNAQRRRNDEWKWQLLSTGRSSQIGTKDFGMICSILLIRIFRWRNTFSCTRNPLIRIAVRVGCCMLPCLIKSDECMCVVWLLMNLLHRPFLSTLLCLRLRLPRMQRTTQAGTKTTSVLYSSSGKSDAIGVI